MVAAATEFAKRAISLSEKDAVITSAATIAVQNLKTEAKVALDAGRSAIEKSAKFGKEASSCV
jgi:hypothetical protein